MNKTGRIKKIYHLFADAFLRFSKFIPVALVLITISFISIHSFSSCLAPKDCISFSRAFNEQKYGLVDHRLIFGMKGYLGKNHYNESETKSIGNFGALTSYAVGINNENESFKNNGEEITPIQSNLLNYNGGSSVEKNFLIQYIRIQYLDPNSDNSFDEKENNIVVSKRFYSNVLKSSQSCKIFSWVTNENLECNVVGYYEFSKPDDKHIIDIFRELYNEPVFFNSQSFDLLYKGNEDFYKNIQVDVEVESDSKYAPYMNRVFSSRGWENDFVKYGTFSSFYESMDQFRSQSNNGFIIMGSIALLILIASVSLLWIFCPKYFDSLITITNPIIVIILWFISTVSIYGLGKLFSNTLLFYEPSFGLTISIIVIFTLIYSLIYYFLAYKRRKAKLNGSSN